MNYLWRSELDEVKQLSAFSFIFISVYMLYAGTGTKKHCALKQKFQGVYVQPEQSCSTGNLFNSFFLLQIADNKKLEAFRKISCRQTFSTVDLSWFCDFDVLWFCCFTSPGGRDWSWVCHVAFFQQEGYLHPKNILRCNNRYLHRVTIFLQSKKRFLSETICCHPYSVFPHLMIY